MVWVFAAIALMIWSLLAWVAYAVADGAAGWVQANAAPTLDSARAISDLTGAGKEVTALVDALGLRGLVLWIANLTSGLAGPLIFLVWAAGSLALVLAPVALAVLGPRLMSLGHGRFRH